MKSSLHLVKLTISEMMQKKLLIVTELLSIVVNDFYANRCIRIRYKRHFVY